MRINGGLGQGGNRVEWRGQSLLMGWSDLPGAGTPTAEEYLSFAFEHCHRSSQKNKRMILIYLLPVKMLLVSDFT